MKKICAIFLAVLLLFSFGMTPAPSEADARREAGIPQDWIYLPELDGYIDPYYYYMDYPPEPLADCGEHSWRISCIEAEHKEEVPFWQDWIYIPELDGYVNPELLDAEISAYCDSRAQAKCPSCMIGDPTHYAASEALGYSYHTAYYSCGHSVQEQHFRPELCTCIHQDCPCGIMAFVGVEHDSYSYSDYNGGSHRFMCKRNCCDGLLYESHTFDSPHLGPVFFQGGKYLHPKWANSKCSKCGRVIYPLGNAVNVDCKINSPACGGGCGA